MLKFAGRSRIPCLGGAPTSSAAAAATSPLTSPDTTPLQPAPAPAPLPSIIAAAPTEADIGRTVHLDDGRSGALRYVGGVRFAGGIWCGLELVANGATGRNDGQVQGVRYFKCPKQRGVMVPLCKVTLVQEDNEESMTSSSGPHSLLITNIGEMDKTALYNDTITIVSNVKNITRSLEKPTAFQRDNTFTKSPPQIFEAESQRASTFCIEDDKDVTLTNNEINLSKSEDIDVSPFTSKACDTTHHHHHHPPSPPSPPNHLPLTAHIPPPPSSAPASCLHSTPFRPPPHPDSISCSTPYTGNYLPPTTSGATSTSAADLSDKRNSLEFEESLGILTPDQMDATGLMTLGCCRSPSAEGMVWFPPSEGAGGGRLQGSVGDTRSCTTEPSSDLSPSLGLIDEHGLAAAFNLRTSSRTNTHGEPLSLSLDVQQLLLRANNNNNNHTRSTSGAAALRVDQTPSPEELPLDPMPVTLHGPHIGSHIGQHIGQHNGQSGVVEGSVLAGGDGLQREEEESDVFGKGEGGRSVSVGVGEKKNGGSFVASIISITSLDTGYQGDGEMSRPGSRGADNSSSPMTRRPQPRRNMCDPMTDSDFYTESDADCHESEQQNQQSLSNHHHHHAHHHQRTSGDRRAQVIDGTLYAVDPHTSAAAADIYANNREPMDSSGVFTDIESSSAATSSDGGGALLNRTIVMASPSDSSTQTITDDSQQQQQQQQQQQLLQQQHQQQVYIECGAQNTAVVKSNSLKTLVDSGSDRGGASVSPKVPVVGRVTVKKMTVGTPGVSAVGMKRPVVESKVFKDVTNANTRSASAVSSPGGPLITSTPTKTPRAPSGAGKWDAVLNKIGKGSRQDEVRSLKEVKSRVYNTMPAAHVLKSGSVGGGGGVGVTPEKGGGRNKYTPAKCRESPKTANTKPRRILRTRTTPSATSAAKHSNVESSINSSLSDLSGASPAKKHSSLKPQRVASSVKLSPRSGSGGGGVTALQQQPSPAANHQHPNQQQQQQLQQQIQGNNNNVNNNNNSGSKNASPVSRGKANVGVGLAGSRTTALLSADKERKTDAAIKDSVARRLPHPHPPPPAAAHAPPLPTINDTLLLCSAASTNHHNAPACIGGGAHLPQPLQAALQQQQQQRLAHAHARLIATTTARTTIAPQASASGTATGKAEYREAALKAEALAVLVQHLVFTVDAFQVPVLKQQMTVMRCDVDTARATCAQLRDTLRDQSGKFASALDSERAKTKAELNHVKQLFGDALEKATKQKDDLEHVVQTLKNQMLKLQKIHEEQLEILREENDSIRDQLDEKNIEVHRMLLHSSITPEPISTETNTAETETELFSSENGLSTENCHGDPNNQEVQSLRAVLDLKQAENSELRKALAEAARKCDRLPSVEERLSTQSARCEDLDLQLKRQKEVEQQLHADIKKLKDSFKAESNQKRRLSQHNEELQWKLQQNKEIFSKVIEQAVEEQQQQQQQQHLNRSTALNSSFSEKSYANSYGSSSCVGALSCSPRHALDRSNSFRGRSDSNVSENSVFTATCSSPTSPKVKGVVTKSDSVSYVLEMDESPEVLASRIVRRSFRTNTSSASASPLKGGGANSPSPKMRGSPSNGGAVSGRLSSSLGGGGSHGGGRLGGPGGGGDGGTRPRMDYLRSRSMTVNRTSESACSDTTTNNTAVTEDEEDDDDDDMGGVFYQFNSNADPDALGQKRRQTPNHSSTPCVLRSERPLHRTVSAQETDDSDEERWIVELPALPIQGTVLPPPRRLATDTCYSEDDENSCSSSASSADRL